MSFAITLQRFQPIARWRAQKFKGLCCIELRQFSSRDFNNCRKSLALAGFEQGFRIVLSASQEGGRARIVAADNGPGIPAHLRAKVLQRFFRLENSRTTQGNGLGLSLAHAIVKLHEANMLLSDNEPGLSVTVLMPETPA